jgi:DNA-binding NarL/FixJ family response regulator
MPQGHDRPIRVMLADDYPGMHPALARVLTPSCEIVGSVTEASRILDEASRLQPDVIVLDIRMPGSNGLETCQRLKAVLPASRIVLYSAIDDAAITRRALEAGAVDFVSKHRITSDLLAAIQRSVNADPTD